MGKTAKKRGKEAFIDYYRSFFADESQFNDFIKSLEIRTLPILRFNPKNESGLRKLWKNAGFKWETVSWYPHALKWPKDVPLGTELPGYKEHLFYPMNPSSLLPALALDVQSDDLILDACAAPGGKALIIAENLGKKGKLIANDISGARRFRMKQIFFDYGFSSIELWGKKAEIIFKTNPDYFDRILVDAPCSSEKHVWNSKEHLKDWSPGRVRQLKQRQLALLCGLFIALKPGGRMVYSTCAITPEENEEVVAKLLKKKQGAIRLVSYKTKAPVQSGIKGEWNEFFDSKKVNRIWPDEEYDPIFVAVFEKLS